VRGGFPIRGLKGGSEITEPLGLAHPRVGMETTIGDEELGSVCLLEGLVPGELQ
jgi:hypothetical protein